MATTHSVLVVVILVVFGCWIEVSWAQCKGTQFLDPIPAPKPSDVLFPLPEQYTYGNVTYSLQPSTFKITSIGAKSGILDRAIRRYQDIIFPTTTKTKTSTSTKTKTKTSTSTKTQTKTKTKTTTAFDDLNTLAIMLQSGDETLQYGVDESYKILISSPTAQITANTVFGALRGLETFSQLVSYEGSTVLLSNGPWIIVDAPRYSHRGLLIDTSRHYLSVQSILNTIDALTYSKLNVLHWHMVDAQSFPVESEKFPLLTNARYADDEVYSKDDLRTIVAYATDRGVRVIPEIDTPGHTASWGVGYPNITVCRDKTRQEGYCAENPCGMLDPSNSFTYEVINGFITELMEIFPDNFFHFGADEVVPACWETPAIDQWMKVNNLSDFQDAFSFFEQQIFAIAKSGNKQPVHWQEVFDEKIKLPSDSIIQVWKDFETLNGVVTAGYRAILANYQAWYLDCGFGNWCPYCSWIDVYTNDPLSGQPLTPQQQALILGGEVAIWGELVDEYNLDSRVWPRAAAAAERLWSPSTVTSISDAFARLIRHNCRLSARGVRGDLIVPGSNGKDCFAVQQ